MFYMLRRTWPSMLKTAMICGTIVYAIGVVASIEIPDDKSQLPELGDNTVESTTRRLDTLETVVAEMLSNTPASEIRAKIWDPRPELLTLSHEHVNNSRLR